MKIIVTHTSPDWDAITSVWVLKRFLSGWGDAKVEFVPAGQRRGGQDAKLMPDDADPIEKIGEDEVIHVDTGLTPLDHHQTQDTNVSAASRSWDYVMAQIAQGNNHLTDEHKEAVSRIVKVVVATDHFKEVFWKDTTEDYMEMGFLGLLDGLKLIKQNQDLEYLEFGMLCLNAMTAQFENRIWAEREIKDKGQKFETRFGKGIGFETINDSVLKLAQKMGYVMVVRKDPRKGYVRIKTLPAQGENKGADLTLAYEQLKKIDPDATWFLHVSKKMLLNGSPKNPKMRPSKLSVSDIIKVLERI
jgi:hypothetical protein